MLGPRGASVGRREGTRDGRRVLAGNLGRVLRQKVVPNNEPGAVQLRLTGGTGEKLDMQVRTTVADTVDVRPCDMRQRLDVARQVHGKDAKLGRELVGQVVQVVVVAWVQHQHERYADAWNPREPPPVVQPDAFVPAATRAAVGRVLAVPQRFG